MGLGHPAGTMRPLWVLIIVGSLVFACTIRTEVNGVPASTSDQTGPDGAPSLAADDASATADAAAAFDATATHDAPAAAPKDGSAADATSCLVLASDYDQTCAADTDCVNVGEALTCPANNCSFCRIETVSMRASAQYRAAFSRAIAAIPADADMCSCPDEGRPCCVRGKCQQCSASP